MRIERDSTIEKHLHFLSFFVLNRRKRHLHLGIICQKLSFLFLRIRFSGTNVNFPFLKQWQLPKGNWSRVVRSNKPTQHASNSNKQSETHNKTVFSDPTPNFHCRENESVRRQLAANGSDAFGEDDLRSAHHPRRVLAPRHHLFRRTRPRPISRRNSLRSNLLSFLSILFSPFVFVLRKHVSLH